MTAEASKPGAGARPRTRRGLWLAGLALLAAHVVFFTLHTDRAARAFENTLVPPNTIPGMAEPRFFLDNDAYAWMAHTRDLMASGGWRLRHTFMDNAPDGRAMHWSHLLIWSLRGIATAIMVVADWPAARAVELAGVWVMPLFQFICIGAFFVVLTKKLGWIPAALFCGLFLSLNGFVWGFHPMRPDHHGLQLGFVLGSFLCLQFGGLGWTRTATPLADSAVSAFRGLSLPDVPEARRWFVAAGVLGGLALWVGATIWMFSLAAIAAAAAAVLPLWRKTAHAAETYQPGLWRLWAGTGCTAGAFFYLLEYAPDHFAMRLEVNHPWFWVFWLGFAEVLGAAGKMGAGGGWKAWNRKDWLLGTIGALAVLSLPLAIALGPPDWHQLREPVLQRLHARFIEEFRSLGSAMGGTPLHRFLYLQLGLLPLALPWAGWLAWTSDSGSPNRRRNLLPGLVFSTLFLGLYLWQQRWGFFLAGGLAWLAMAALAETMATASPVPARRFSGWAIAAVLLANVVAADAARLRSERLAATSESVIPAWVQSCVMKRMALQFGLAAGPERWRMVGLAAEAPMLYYFAGIQTVASYYWENAEGWKAESAFFADAPDGAQAREIARARGLTHACISLSPELPKLFWFISTGRYSESEGLQKSLAGQLALKNGGQVPGWFRRDEKLSEIGEQFYVFRTPRGLVRQKTWAQVYRLETESAP